MIRALYTLPHPEQEPNRNAESIDAHIDCFHHRLSTEKHRITGKEKPMKSYRLLYLLLVLGMVLAGCSEDPLSGDDEVWVPIPEGSFMMGCIPGDLECDGYNGLYGESPRHLVNIPAFEMTRTEITQYQYWKVTGKQPSYHPTCGDCPVEYMEHHYHDAKAFCEAIGGRLPSEAEWEYAARAGSTTKYMCGDDMDCLDDIAWHGHNTELLDPELIRHPQPVAQKQPNAFGLYDMTGNIQEWVEDCSHPNYEDAPTDGSAWMDEGNSDCTMHVFKGSTYNTEIGVDWGADWLARPSGRYWDAPHDIRGIADGFRCARDYDPAR